MQLLQRWRARRAPVADAGFGMVELLVSMVVFSVIATGVAIGLQSAIATTRQDRMRVQGAHLAARELELARHEFGLEGGVAALAGTASVTNPHPLQPASAQPMQIDGVPFTVVRSVQWLPAGAGQSACDGGAAVGFPVLAVNVRVTWGRMGSVQPVESNTLLTPSKKVVSGTASYIAVKVVGAAGTPQTGVPVQLAGGGVSSSSVTADDGCAVFQVSPTTYPQNYTLTASKSGWVDYYGNAVGTSSATLNGAGTLERPAPISYDQAARLVATMALDANDTAAGYRLPTTLPPWSLYNSGLATGSTATKTVASTGATTTITGLWPFASGYESWPGACGSASDGHPGATVVAPGASGSISHRLVPVAVTVLQSNGQPYKSGAVVAMPEDTTGCTTTEQPLQLGRTANDGTLLTSLPPGSWQISAASPAVTASIGLVVGVTEASAAQTATVTLSTP